MQKQKVGLSQQYKKVGSDISQWLKGVFGIEEVADCFVKDFMTDLPYAKPCIDFADYLTETYITDELLFPPYEPQSRTDKKKEQNLLDLHSPHCQQEITRFLLCQKPRIYISSPN